ncbi:MAG: hypothetical protein WCE31_01070, partial [Priestia megaterium]
GLFTHSLKPLLYQRLASDFCHFRNLSQILNQLTYLFFIIQKITLLNVNKRFYPTFLLYSKQNDFKRDNGLFFETLVNLFSLSINKNSTSMCCFSQVCMIYDTIYP